MKFSEKAKEAMRDPNVRTAFIDLTPERRQRYERISAELIDFLKAQEINPVEAYMILHFVMESFEETYGIRGGIIESKGEAGKS